MVKMIEMNDMDETVKTFFNGINIVEDQYLILDAGKPVFCIIRPDEKSQSQRFSVFNRMWNNNQEVDEKDVEQVITEAISEVRFMLI